MWYVGNFFFFSSRRRHTRLQGDWSSDVCSSDLGIRAGVPISLRRLMHGEVRRAVEIEHEIEVLAARLRGTLEIDGADRAAGHHALAMILAAIEIDLIAPVDGVFGADLDAGVAARANIE